jgi:integrase/recombinase XerC
MMGTETDDLLLYYDYLAKLGRSPVTIRNYLSNLKLFSRWFTKTSETERIDFTQVTEIDLLSYRNHLQYSERHKTSTINQHVAALRSFFSFLHNSGSISEAVAKNLRPLSKPYLRAPEVPKRVQVLKLFRMVDTQNDRGKRDFAILQLFVQCGLRLSEVANIQLDDINISERKGTLRIITGKSGSERKVHLNKTARHAIKAYLRVRPTLPETNKLFLSQLNRPLSTRSIYHLTKKYLEAAGMPDLSCHSLRHLFATNLYNRHKDILLVKEALGHKTLESTLRYSHKSEEDIAKAMENSNLNIYAEWNAVPSSAKDSS